MRNFFINIFIFLIIFLILNLWPNLVLNPYFGNKCYYSKYKFYKENEQKYNTIILGSSRLYRQINPQVLDNILKNYKISTFNLASPSTYNPEIYYLYENLLRNLENRYLKYVLLELQTINNISSDNLKTARNYYWHNLKYLFFVTHYSFASDFSLKGKIKLINKYVLSYTNKFVYGYRSIFANKIKENALVLGNNKDGFYPLDAQMADIGGNNYLRERYIKFQEDKSSLDKRKAKISSLFSRKESDLFINNNHLAKLNKLIEKSKQKGIHLVFIIPSRTFGYDKLLGIKSKLPKKHVIEIANPEKYPELYEVEFTFDIGHLNKKGAKIFTEYLASEIQENILNSHKLVSNKN